MKQLYGEGAFAPLPVNNGFVFIAQQPAGKNAAEPTEPVQSEADEAKETEQTDKMTVGYKIYRFDDQAIYPVTRSVYLLAKFGINFDNYQRDFKKYLLCKIISLDPKHQLVIDPNGEARIVNSSDELSWIGNLCFNGEPPCCVHHDSGVLWATYSKNGAVIKYDAASMHDELRIGGGKLKSFENPEGIWADKRSVLICSDGKILRIDLDSFETTVYRTFDEPVRNYFRIYDEEIVQLDSGFYAL